MDVEKGYNNNPYHSFYHAVDVVMVLCYLLESCELSRYLTSTETAILFIAALCHDIGHPGKNNQFEVSCQSKLAREFSNLSVLESKSCQMTLELMDKHGLERHVYPKELKQSTVKMILATDMVCHFALLENISILRSIIHQDTRQRLCPLSPLFMPEKDPLNYFQDAFPPSHAYKAPDSTQLTGPSQLLPEERLMLCHILIHAADISNPCRPWPIFYHAAQLVCTEFFRQAEEEFHMRLIPHIGNTNPSTISVGFIDFIVYPYFQAISELCPKSASMMETCVKNRQEWIRLSAEDVSENKKTIYQSLSNMTPLSS
ncbi:hypothetical protein G6F43_004556 [Rhizopus delemar]|nr:hypothetical protein G6F43_004556 [Rhizopus delemar]